MVFYALLHFAFRHRIAERWLFLAAILAQGLFEIAQPMVGRSASWARFNISVKRYGFFFGVVADGCPASPRGWVGSCWGALF